MSTQTETISRRVIELVSEKMNIPFEQISLDSQFIADLGFDSLDVVEFIMLVEDEFDVTISDEGAQKIATVKDSVTTIQKLLQGSNEF